MIKRENPFDRIYRQCNGKSNIEKYNLFNRKCMVKTPIYLDVELTNYCNIRCNMCPVGTGAMKRKQGFMSEMVFDKILYNIREFQIQGVRFIRWGEPVLHPRFIEWGGMLKREDVLVHFNTNGLLLKEDMIKEIIDLKIDSIKFSFQGIDDLTYSEMRREGNYAKLIETIKNMYKMRGDNEKPFISVSTSTTYETEEEITRFKEEISQYCDEVNVGKTLLQHVDIKCMGVSKERQEIYERFMREKSWDMNRHAACPEIWDKLSINWDGSVSACCADYDDMMIVGNILENNLQELFYNQKEMKFREILKDNNYDILPLCRNCYEYIPLKH